MSEELNALEEFYIREGHLRVPLDHIEPMGAEMVQLGRFMTTARARSREGILDGAIQLAIETYKIDDWDAPVTGPPKRFISRDENIRALRRTGMSLQKIADMYKISRQRTHQIIHAR